MSKYADYDFYIDTYNGTMAESDFERKIAAGTAVDTPDGAQRRKGGELASQTVGPWTKVYKGSGKTADQRKAEAAETYLLMTGLLYRGGGA